MKHSLSRVAALTLLAACATPLLGSPEKRASVEGITEYRLDNSMRVLLFPDPSQPTMTVNLTVLVGSRHEGYGEAGMAHLLEHMLFKGTPTFPNGKKALTDKGARWNGTTWFDRTNYFETLPAGDENLEFAIRFEADRLVNCPIRAEDLASEMTVVRNEFERGENHPQNILEERMLHAAFSWHNYGKPTIGNRADIERVPAERLRAFYKKYYQPDNALLVIAGQFDEAKALAWAQKYLGAIRKPERTLEATYTEEPPQDGERVVRLRRMGSGGAVGVLFHVPAGPDPEFAAVELLNHVLTDSPRGELYKALIADKKATEVRGWAAGLHDPGYLSIEATLKEGQPLEEARQTLIATLDRIAEGGVTAEQVERARRSWLAERKRSQTDIAGLAIQLSNWASQGDWRLYFAMRDRIEKVSVEEVRAAARKYLRASNRTVGIYEPTKEADRVAIAPAPDAAVMLKDYVGQNAAAAGEQLDPDPAKLETRVIRPAAGEGVRVALLPKKSREEMAWVRLTLRYGDAKSLKGMRTAEQLLPELMLRGTRTLTREQLSDRLDALSATLSAEGPGALESAPGQMTFVLQAPRPHLAEAIDLLRQVLREPALSQEEFELARREREGALEQVRQDPETQALYAMRRALRPFGEEDVRYEPSVEEDLHAPVSLDQVRDLYARWVGAGAGELAVVGDFDPSSTLAAMHAALEGWKSSYRRIPMEAVGAAPTEQMLQTPDKANAILYAGQVWAMKQEDPDYPALVLAGQVLGGMSGRLWTRVREKEGLSYGVRAAVQALPLDAYARLTISAIYNPANRQKVRQAVREEIIRLANEGVGKEELAGAKEAYLQERAMNRMQEKGLAKVLAEDLYAGRTLAYEASFESQVRATTAAQVSAAARKYLSAEKLFVIMAGDFATKSK